MSSTHFITIVWVSLIAWTNVVSALNTTTTNATASIVPLTSSSGTGTHISFCRKFGGFHETIVVSVQSKKFISQLRALNVTEAPCKAVCSSICSKTSCLASASLTITANGRERCSCPSKCSGLKNVFCDATTTNTCQCRDGFWGTNVSTAGCPNRGFYVKPLAYSFSAFEPVIDNATMFIHHQKHHKAYVDALNYALRNSADLLKPIVQLQANAIAGGSTIRNNAGGHYNHALFWTILAPPAVANKTKPSSQLLALMKASYGNQFNMMTVFNRVASSSSTFGSGWVWLCLNAAGSKLIVVNTPNQDNPLMKGTTNETMYPILGLDVWEHAYYLKYNIMRDTYVSNFWKLVNWNKVSENAAYIVTNKQAVSV